MMTSQSDVQRAYEMVWRRRAFSNLCVLCSWDDVTLAQWMRMHKPGAPKKGIPFPGAIPDPSQVESMTSTDCVVFAVQLAQEVGTVGQFVHDGGHGALEYQQGDRCVAVDSSARAVYTIGDEEDVVLLPGEPEERHYRRRGGITIQKNGKCFERTTKEETIERTFLHQWRSDEVIVLLRVWHSPGIGRFCGQIKFTPKRGQLSWSASRLDQTFVRTLDRNTDPVECIGWLDGFVKEAALEEESITQWRNIRPDMGRILAAWIATRDS